MGEHPGESVGVGAPTVRPQLGVAQARATELPALRTLAPCDGHRQWGRRKGQHEAGHGCRWEPGGAGWGGSVTRRHLLRSLRAATRWTRQEVPMQPLTGKARKREVVPDGKTPSLTEKGGSLLREVQDWWVGGIDPEGPAMKRRSLSEGNWTDRKARSPRHNKTLCMRTGQIEGPKGEANPPLPPNT